MAGHSHWAQVKRAKGANDAKRGKTFSRMAREIMIAAKAGGGDPAMNPRLRQAIVAAKAESVPKDTIERAIKRGTGEIAGETIEELTYEAYAPGGVALLVEATTDNKNRTAAEIRAIFTKHNAALGSPGSVAWMFQRCGLIEVPSAGTDEDTVMMAAIDSGAEDMTTVGDTFSIRAPVDKLYAVEEALRKQGIAVRSAKIAAVPSNQTPVTDEKVAGQVMALIEALDDHDDIQNVYSNIDIPDALMAKLAAA
ncbi:MAG TPA: YebC/PmpR family DNA-binding transcriptional regulator [Verrucomicrobiae bacterium]|nr:YebC/PmpR family DNA-binding transcriptional regulator [Verrucomicrobiae bacterium]